MSVRKKSVICRLCKVDTFKATTDLCTSCYRKERYARNKEYIRAQQRANTRRVEAAHAEYVRSLHFPKKK